MRVVELSHTFAPHGGAKVKVKVESGADRACIIVNGYDHSPNGLGLNMVVLSPSGELERTEADYREALRLLHALAVVQDDELLLIAQCGGLRREHVTWCTFDPSTGRRDASAWNALRSFGVDLPATDDATSKLPRMSLPRLLDYARQEVPGWLQEEPVPMTRTAWAVALTNARSSAQHLVDAGLAHGCEPLLAACSGTAVLVTVLAAGEAAHDAHRAAQQLVKDLACAGSVFTCNRPA
jgi:hypothetical protein